MTEHSEELGAAIEKVRQQDRDARDSDIADEIDQSQRLADSLERSPEPGPG